MTLLRRRLPPAAALLAAAGALLIPVPATAIVGGQHVPIGAVPWQASVASAHAVCGGVIVSPTRIATAAHCVVAAGAAAIDGADTLRVYVGTEDRRALPPPLRPVAVYADRGYGTPTLESNDLAVIELAPEDALATSAAVAPVPVADTAQDAAYGAAGETVTISGWGLTAPFSGDPASQPTDPLLKAARVGVIAADVCSPFSPSVPIAADQICLLDPENGFCNGDSGGPITAATPGGPLLVGIISAGPKGCTDGVRRVGMRVAWHRDLLLGAAPAFVPAVQSPVAIAGDAVAGQALTCTPGTFAGGAAASSTGFALGDGSLVRGTQWTPSPADVGVTVRCWSQLTTGSASVQSRSAAVTVAAAAAPTEPAFLPPIAGEPKPPAAPGAAGPPRPSLRSLQPVCARGRCRIVVTLAAPARGSVSATFRIRRRCASERRNCSWMQTVRVTRTLHGARTLTLSLGRVPRGTRRVTIATFGIASRAAVSSRTVTLHT